LLAVKRHSSRPGESEGRNGSDRGFGFDRGAHGGGVLMQVLQNVNSLASRFFDGAFQQRHLISRAAVSGFVLRISQPSGND